MNSFILSVATIKAITMATVTLLIGTAFWQSIVIALVSGSLGVFGMISAAYVASREAKQNRSILHDINKKVGINKRETDDIT